jgi:hypothetical protein
MVSSGKMVFSEKSSVRNIYLHLKNERMFEGTMAEAVGWEL